MHRAVRGIGRDRLRRTGIPILRTRRAFQMFLVLVGTYGVASSDVHYRHIPVLGTIQRI